MLIRIKHESMSELLAVSLMLDLQKFPHENEISSQSGPKLVRQNIIGLDFSFSKYNSKL